MCVCAAELKVVIGMHKMRTRQTRSITPTDDSLNWLYAFIELRPPQNHTGDAVSGHAGTPDEIDPRSPAASNADQRRSILAQLNSLQRRMDKIIDCGTRLCSCDGAVMVL